MPPELHANVRAARVHIVHRLPTFCVPIPNAHAPRGPLHAPFHATQGVTFPEDVTVSISEEEALRVIQGAQEYQQAAGARRGAAGAESDAALAGWWDSNAAGGGVGGFTDSWTEIAKVCTGMRREVSPASQLGT